MPLNIPFNYLNILIGEEIIYRALRQQQYLADRGEYGMQWTSQDAADLNAYLQQANTARQSFTGIPVCVPYPPCTWEKQNDEVSYSEFHDIVMMRENERTYRVRVHLRTDNGTSSFTIGEQVIEFRPDDAELDPVIRDQFTFKRKKEEPKTGPEAVIVIERLLNGVVDKTYYYLFDLD